MASPTAPLFWQTRPFARDSELRLSRKKHLNPQLAPLHVGTVPNTCHRGPIRAPAGRPRLLSPWTSRHAPSRNEDHGRHSERTGGKEKGDGGDSSHGCCTLTPCENPSESEKANKLVEAAFHATGLRAAAEFLRSSRAAFIGSVAAFATALLLPRLFQGSAACEAASQALTGVVYLLAGLPGFMDVCHDVASLTINTHVLTMLSVACLVPMGHALEVRWSIRCLLPPSSPPQPCQRTDPTPFAPAHPYQGALLLLLFNLSHELEDTLTATAQGDMRALLNSVPSTAAVVQLGADGEPDLSTETEVAAEDVVVGQLVAVRAGQEVGPLAKLGGRGQEGGSDLEEGCGEDLLVALRIGGARGCKGELWHTEGR